MTSRKPAPAAIRTAELADANLLPDIERSAGQAFRALPDLAWIAEDDVQSVERHRELIAGGAAWVAAEDETPVGFLSAEICGEALHIWELAVRHEHQGRGLGRRLIDHGCAWAAARNLRAVTLTTFRQVSWNEPFYRSCGFETQSSGAITPRLQAILADEIAAGLPGDRRCAMAKTLERLP